MLMTHASGSWGIPLAVPFTLLAVLLPGGVPDPSDSTRVAEAEQRHHPRIRKVFRELELPYPPPAVYLRYFKWEKELELWAGVPDRPLTRIRSYPALGSSGELGPKRREGDFQIPEGLYRIDRFNPRSRFHLSLGIDYPRPEDLARAGNDPPGGDIFIHGGAVTVGCIPIGDEAIEELYLIARDARVAHSASIPVHLFPCRMDGAGMEFLRPLGAGQPELGEFWAALREHFLAFEATQRIPELSP